MAKTTTKDEGTGMIRSMHIPREVRDGMRAEAQARGISTSAMVRDAMREYVAGDLEVPEMTGPELVSTSMWMPAQLWDEFTRKSEAEGFPTQWIFRAWLQRQRAAA